MRNNVNFSNRLTRSPLGQCHLVKGRPYGTSINSIDFSTIRSFLRNSNALEERPYGRKFH